MRDLIRVLALVSCVFLTACQSDVEPDSSFATVTPEMLRSVPNDGLSVVVRVDGVGPDFPGEQTADGQWVVKLNVALDATHTFVISWYYSIEESRVLLMEQRGEFYASADNRTAQAISTDFTAGDPRFDPDCDNMSNLVEIEGGSNPLTKPGCTSGDNSSESGNTDSSNTDGDMNGDSTEVAGSDDVGSSTDANAAPSNDVGSDPGSETDADAQGGTTVGETSQPNNPGVVDDTGRLIPSTDLPDLVSIPGGRFQMGSPALDVGQRKEDERQHWVTVDGFSIGRYEVTFDQYTLFAEQPGRAQSIPHDRGWGREDRPVIQISWQDAIAYTQWLSERTGDTYRLPTEAEWEYAARGGTQTPFWTGNTIRGDQENINSEDPWGGGVSIGFSWGRTIPVGSLKPNPYGLYDMLGNALEYTCSVYDADYNNGSETSCSNDIAIPHLHRGGTYYSGASSARVYRRGGTLETNKHSGELGFRVVRDN